MKRKIIPGIVSLVVLSSFVVLANSPRFVGGLLEAVQNNSISKVFSSSTNSTESAKTGADKVEPKPTPEIEDKNVREIPDAVLWYMVFGMNETIKKESEKLVEQGQDDGVWRDYFKQQAKISDEQAAILTEKSAAYLDEIKPIDDKAKEIIEKVRAAFPKGKIASKSEISKPLVKLRKLQDQKNKVTLSYRDDYREAVGEEAFGQFTNFLKNNFSKGIEAEKLELPIEEDSPQFYYLQSQVTWNDTLVIPIITGDALTYFDYETGLFYDPYVFSVFGDETINLLYSYGSNIGYGGIFPAQVFHPWFPSVRGHLFCTESEHWALSTLILAPENSQKTKSSEIPSDRMIGRIPDKDAPQFSPYDVFLDYTEYCHVVALLPPTPTPTPTPPICTPLSNGLSPETDSSLPPCPTPTATPTPTPTPSSNIMISPIDAVEKYGEQTVNVTVMDNAGGTTKFTIRTTNGTGNATFANGSSEVIVNGNVTDQPLTIKGVTESSQANNIIIEARLNNDSTVVASDEFTVAIITALVFEKFDTDYASIDSNPGNGQAGTNIGQRIYPGKIDVADVNSSKDRALVKVKATVSPTIPNVTLYYGSYDLDDPSANMAPLDTNGSMGNDNNGTVNNSTSGDFTIPTGINCADPTTGHVPGKIGCTIASDGTATAAFKTTMQPGDNFAVAVSLNSSYRDAIAVNPNSGMELLNAGNIIHISGEQNEDQNAGIRTQMLTVWRKLHIEVDSMGDATGNKVEGMMGENRKVGSGTKTVLVTVSPALEPNRFENGRMVIGSRSFPVVNTTSTQDANTADTVTIWVNSAFNITTTTPFMLYDDDDMDDDDVGMLNGDEGDDVDEPDFGLLTSNDVPCSNVFNTNNCNILAAAYVRPVRDLTVSHENTGFYINATDANLASIRATFFQNRQYEASTVFWTIYLLGAYQYTEQDDGDPDLQGAVLGITDGVTANDGEGSVIFNEVNRTHEYNVLDIFNPTVPSWTTRPINRRFTIAHEVGHLFGGTHQDYTTSTTNAGLMAQSSIRLNPLFTDATINIIRGGTMLTHP